MYEETVLLKCPDNKKQASIIDYKKKLSGVIYDNLVSKRKAGSFRNRSNSELEEIASETAVKDLAVLFRENDLDYRVCRDTNTEGVFAMGLTQEQIPRAIKKFAKGVQEVFKEYGKHQPLYLQKTLQ